MTEKRPAADLLTDVAYFVEDDNGEWATVFDGEVIQAELVDEPAPPAYAAGGSFQPATPLMGDTNGIDYIVPRDTRWLPNVPELNPRRRYPNGDNPIFDELDQHRETKTRKSYTKSMRRLSTGLDRWKAQHRLEEGAHRDRVWEIEHASPLLNQLGQP